MFPFKKFVSVFVVVLAAILFVMALDWYHAKLRAAKEETKAVVNFHQSETHLEIGDSGQTVATQPKVEVSKATFKNLTQKKIKQVERESGLELGNVSALTEGTVTTEREFKAPLYTDTLHAKNCAPGSLPIVIRKFRAATRFGSISGTIAGDSITIRDSTTNPLMVLETRPRWKIRHLWPWNWGTRKREVKLLIFNPNSRIDTLSNISIVP